MTTEIATLVAAALAAGIAALNLFFNVSHNNAVALEKWAMEIRTAARNFVTMQNRFDDLTYATVLLKNDTQPAIKPSAHDIDPATEVLLDAELDLCFLLSTKEASHVNLEQIAKSWSEYSRSVIAPEKVMPSEEFSDRLELFKEEFVEAARAVVQKTTSKASFLRSGGLA